MRRTLREPAIQTSLSPCRKAGQKYTRGVQGLLTARRTCISLRDVEAPTVGPACKANSVTRRSMHSQPWTALDSLGQHGLVLHAPAQLKYTRSTSSRTMHLMERWALWHGLHKHDGLHKHNNRPAAMLSRVDKERLWLDHISKVRTVRRATWFRIHTSKDSDLSMQLLVSPMLQHL